MSMNSYVRVTPTWELLIFCWLTVFVSVFCLFTDVDVSYLLIKTRNTSIELITYDYRPTYKSKQGYV